MDYAAMLKQAGKAIAPYRVTSGKGFSLADFDAGDTQGFGDAAKPAAKELLTATIASLAELQAKLYAGNRWGVLLIFQAMDAAGKDGTIKHVMSGVNPQGCQVFSFKQPSLEELDHDFLWRYHRALPERGRIGIFNRSYYEEVLVVRVHKQILGAQRLPAELIGKHIWRDRLDDIAHLEEYLARNGFLVLKFYLNVSKDEQKRQFFERLDEPDKHWKFAEADISERGFWDEYRHAYQEAIRHTAMPQTPWYVVPADNKWFTRLIVASAVVHHLEKLGLAFPEIDESRRAHIAEARRILEAE